MFRWLFIAVIMLWAAAMAALVKRDVWPAWTAQDAPRVTADNLARHRVEEQFGIFDSEGTRLGAAWSDVEPQASGHAALTGTLLIEGLSLIPAIRIETTTEFDTQGELDSFRMDVFGVPMTKIWVAGERRGIYFPCELQVGPLYRQANLDMSASRMIGESLRPFTVLPNLYVGQSWRMQILDPLSAVHSRKAEFKPVVAQVTRKEQITTQLTGTVECFVVEIRDQGSTAWVTSDGRVLRQEVSVPGLKHLRLEAEKYSAVQRQRARHKVRMMNRPEEEVERLGRRARSWFRMDGGPDGNGN